MINKELEKENAELKRHIKADCIDCEDYYKNKRLEKENAELKKRVDNLYNSDCWASDQLTKAKEIIQNIIRITWGEGWNYSLDWKVKAEQFLQEIEKC
jgi:hypothetical protein